MARSRYKVVIDNPKDNRCFVTTKRKEAEVQAVEWIKEYRAKGFQHTVYDLIYVTHLVIFEIKVVK